MEFEFYPEKSALNLSKHGIDFSDAQNIWKDPDALKDIPDSYKDGEHYWLAVGEVSGKVWSAIYNIRSGRYHLVSVRRARDYERKEYEILKER